MRRGVMQLRSQNVETQISIGAREVIGPYVPEIGRVNAEVARLLATHDRPNLSEADGAALLSKAIAASLALTRIEREIDGALRGLPSEIAQHGRVRDLRAAIDAIRGRLVQLGAIDA